MHDYIVGANPCLLCFLSRSIRMCSFRFQHRLVDITRGAAVVCLIRCPVRTCLEIRGCTSATVFEISEPTVRCASASARGGLRTLTKPDPD